MGLLNAIDKFEGFVGVNLWTMIFAWINLLILYLVLKKILFKPIKNMIDARQAEIDGIYKDAEDSRTAAAELKEEYEERIGNAEKESAEILKTAVRKAQLKEEEIIREAKAEADRTLSRAHEQVELEKRRAVNEVKDEVSEIAIGIATAVIGRDVSAAEHKELIDGFINELGN